MMWSVYRLNKQGDSRQPCHTPFSILNQSVVPPVEMNSSCPLNSFYLFMAVLSLHCCARAFSSCGGYSLVAVHGLLIVVGSPVAKNLGSLARQAGSRGTVGHLHHPSLVVPGSRPVDPAECPGDGPEGELFSHWGACPSPRPDMRGQECLFPSQILQKGLKSSLSPGGLHSAANKKGL